MRKSQVRAIAPADVATSVVLFAKRALAIASPYRHARTGPSGQPRLVCGAAGGDCRWKKLHHYTTTDCFGKSAAFVEAGYRTLHVMILDS